ncbi:MAG: NifU family protein [Candidatus Pacebacteria bacterium]|nr:NifU family protein [Candidatus Paceibacterota bacterium]
MENKIKETIKKEVSPVLEQHGGFIEFAGFDEEKGIVKVKLGGACASCPYASSTLTEIAEKVLKEKFSEVKKVENIG